MGGGGVTTEPVTYHTQTAIMHGSACPHANPARRRGLAYKRRHGARRRRPERAGTSRKYADESGSEIKTCIGRRGSASPQALIGKLQSV